MTTLAPHRLVTRSDMDGLISAVLLRARGIIHKVVFAHPRDMQNGLFSVESRDITTNLPWVPGVFLAFDNHASELERLGIATRPERFIADITAPSTTRVVYDYFGGIKGFPTISKDLICATDKTNAARFTLEEILYPTGWNLLSFLTDARTGLGRFRDFTISNYQLMMNIIDYCLHYQDVEAILNLPDVRERKEMYTAHAAHFEAQIKRCTRMYGFLAVLDLRGEDIIWTGNRFMIYALFPQAAASLYVVWGKNRQNTVFTLGQSIFNDILNLDIGALCLAYQGGGHAHRGTCQVDNIRAETVKAALIRYIQEHG